MNLNDALRWASKRGHLGVVEALLKAGANVHAIDNYALRWASENGHLSVVEALQKHVSNTKRATKERAL